MKARIKWVEGRVFTGTSNSGHGIVIAAPTGPGAPTIAPSPMEYVLLGTGGCTATDVVMILEKGRQDIRAVEVELDSDRVEFLLDLAQTLLALFHGAAAGLDIGFFQFDVCGEFLEACFEAPPFLIEFDFLSG